MMPCTSNVRRSLLVAALFAATFANSHAAVTQIGNITGVSTSTDPTNGAPIVTFTVSGGGAVSVTAYAPDVVRVRYHFTGLWDKEEPMIHKPLGQWTAASTTFSDQGTYYLLSTTLLDVIINKSPFKVDFKDKTAGYYLSQDWNMEYDPAYNYTGQRGTSSSKLKCSKVVGSNQAFFGLGEYGGPLNRRGKELECWSVGTYNWGELQNPTYMNMPFFYGVQPANGSIPAYAYGIFFNNPCRPLFKFGTQSNTLVSFEAGDGQLDYFFFGGGANHTMGGVIDRYSELTGRATMLPKWGFGHQLSRFSYSNQSWVEYIANQATTDDIPLDVVYLDIDYMDANGDNNIGDGQLKQLTMNFNFPNPASMINTCNSKGVKVIPLIEPWLEPGDSALYPEANGLAHFIKDNSGNTVTRSIYVGNVSWFDYTSTPMRQWWQGKIINWFNSYNGGNPSFAGIWNDLTEPEGGDQIPYNGLLWVDGHYGTSTTDSRRQWSNEHNYFGLRASGQSYDTMKAKNPSKRPYILGRSGTSGLQRYAISWSGDTRANWFYQRATLRFGMGAMIAGAGWYGNDVGGFAGTPTSELLVRSYEANILTPFFRNHADKGAADREPWRFSDPHKSMMRDGIKFRYKLMPYLYTLAYNFTQNGEPMNTPTVFKFHGDVNTASLNDYEYMVGDWLLAAPIYNEGATTRTLYLPWSDGIEWYYWPTRDTYTGASYGGGQTITVNAPLGSLPLFVRAGAIIPMGPAMQYVNQTTPDSLDLNCWPSGNSSFTLYEDAGEGWDFTNSTGRAQTTFTSVRSSNTWDFTVGAKQGGYSTGRNKYYIYVYNPQSVQAVTLDGFTLYHASDFNDLVANPQGWVMTTDGKLAIKIPDTGIQHVIHVDWTGAPPTPSGPGLGIPGTWSAWEDDNSPWFLGKVSPPGTPAAANWYTNSIQVGVDIAAGTYQFKLRGNHDWANNWGLNAAGSATIDGVTTLSWVGSTNVAITLQSGFYYSFRVLEPTPTASAPIAVMRTTNKPVGVTFAGASPANPTSSEMVTVSITLSAAKSSQEHIYTRWTTNNWTTSAFTEATGSGVDYTATLPPFPNGTTVNYYIMSSTAIPGGTLSHSTADLLTLALDTNGGANYTFGVNVIPWPGFGYPSDPAANIHHWKEEAIVGNGHMSAMLDMNGTLYDIYFPTVGARSGSATANEGYRGPMAWPPDCASLDREANGQMNLIAAMGGISVPVGGTNNMYWLKNQSGTDYTDIGQRWLSDDTDVVVTSNRLTHAGYNIKVQQYDFIPVETALPVITDGTRTNRAVYIKRFLLTNNEATSKTINFYWDANFNIKGDNASDEMFWEGSIGGTNYNAMVVRDTVGRVINGSWCTPNGYGGTAGTEYDPAGAPGGWAKSNSVYFATVMKLVTNATTGAGAPADGSWRDHSATDNQEGWIGKKITIPAGQTVEVDVMTVGSWDTFAGATGTHAFWGRRMIHWFYNNNMSDAQTATEGYWSNWIASGVTVDFPDDTYDRLFKRSLIVSKLHCDALSGAVIAGMHNGAYPFVWPRDGVYAAVTFDRTGHPQEALDFYRWLKNADRPSEPWGQGYFYQKYTTDGKPVWRSPQVDETSSVPWGMYYHYLVTGDGAFLTNNYALAYSTARASSEDSVPGGDQLYFDDATRLMWSWNVWEDKTNAHLYSNGSVVRGLQDAASIADLVGQSTTASVFRARATDIRVNGITQRINNRAEPSDISHLGLVWPFEVFAPNDPLMTNVVEWLHGRQSAGGFTGNEGNIVETAGDNIGMLRRYNHKIGGELDTYWNGGPWTLSTAWYGMYYARWQDYLGGKDLVNTNKLMLDKIIAKLGPMGLAAEQIAGNVSEQKYPGFWHQTAWPNVWESHSTLVDQMMLFLDYKPGTNNTCAFAPKLPTGWTSLKFNNLAYRNERFDVTVTENDQPSAHYTRADFMKLTTGSFNVDIYLRIPAGLAPVMVVTNGGYYAPAPADVDTATGRVRVRTTLPAGTGPQTIAVTWDITGCPGCPGPNNDWDGDGLADSLEMTLTSSPIDSDSDDDGMNDGFEYNYFGHPTNADPNADADGDGQNNLAESIASTVPNNAGSHLRIVDITRQPNGDVVITGASVTGKKYALLATTSLGSPFTTISTTNTATGATISFTDTAPSATGKHYKIQIIP